MPRPKSIPLVCQQCGAEFICTQSEANRGRRYCSTACRYAADTGNTVARFWSRVEKTDTCWLWTAAKDKYGYGHIRTNRASSMLVHRFAYELLIGPIPDGMVIDHVWDRGCRNRHCVNPAHLEAVTLAVNSGRGKLARRQTCAKGHPYDARTYRKTDGSRRCRVCKAEYQRQYRLRKRMGIG